MARKRTVLWEVSRLEPLTDSGGLYRRSVALREDGKALVRLTLLSERGPTIRTVKDYGWRIAAPRLQELAKTNKLREWLEQRRFA